MKQAWVQTRHRRIHYLEEGRGEILVLLHSNGNSAFQYEAVLPALARNRRVFAIDLPGHGDSDPITHHYSIEMYADAVAGFLDALGIGRAAVAGSSVGGTICIALGRDHAHRARPVVIVEAPIRSEADWRATWPQIEASCTQVNQTFEILKPRYRAVTPELLNRNNIDRNKAGAWTMVDVMQAMREFDTEAALRSIVGPAAAMIGEKGNVISSHSVYEECLGAERVAIIPESGHFPMTDNPEAFARELERLLTVGAKHPATA